jgi:regulator of sigma E protease
MTILLVVAILVFLIVVHELGHFALAKLFKVKVEEFGIGYPPRAFRLGVVNGTEYTLNWIPFGGFVRLLGENADAPKEKGSFATASRFVQALILVAGVTMNLVAGWALFAGALYAGIPHAVAPEDSHGQARLVVSAVIPGSPAGASDMIPGDEILSVADSVSGEEALLTPENVIEFVRARGGKPTKIRTLRGAEEIETTMYPAHSVIAAEANRPAVGLGLVLVENDPLPLLEAMRVAMPMTIDKLFVVADGLVGIFRNALQGAPALEGIVGPVGLVGVVGEASQHGIGTILALAGFISINLVIVNLLPIPALDGGRLFLLGLESIIRRDAPRLIVAGLNSIGIVAIIVLMITVTYNDIVRLFV